MKVSIQVLALASYFYSVPRDSKRRLGEELRDAVSVELIVLSDEIQVYWISTDDETAINVDPLTVSIVVFAPYWDETPYSRDRLVKLAERLKRVIERSAHVPRDIKVDVQPFAIRESWSIQGQR